jgi:hypothetical protein
MALNFGILQPANISGQLQAGQESAMRNQLAQQQLAAGQQQMETGRMQQEKAGLEMQQFRRRQSALDKFLSDAEKGGYTGDPEDVAKSFFDFAITSGEPQVVMAAQQALMAAKERKAYMTSRTPTAAPAMPAAPGALGSGTFDLNAPRPTPATNMLAPAAAPANALAMPDTKALEDKIFSLETQFANVPAAQKEAAMLKERLKELYTPRVVGRSLVVGTRPVYTEPERPFAPPSSVAEFERARTDPAFMQFLQDRAAAIRPPAQPAQPSAPVAVVDESGRVKYVTREQAMGMTPATAIEGLSPKEIQKREAVLPQARQAVKTVGNTMSVIGETVDRLLANPEGLNGITGTIYGRTPAFTDAANTANADLEQLKNLAFVQGLTELRAASKTGAGVGNVSNREGERFENLKASLDRRQSKTDLENALRRLKEQAGFTTQTMQEAFDETYKYKQTAPAPAATQGTGGFKYLGKESGK